MNFKNLRIIGTIEHIDSQTCQLLLLQVVSTFGHAAVQPTQAVRQSISSTSEAANGQTESSKATATAASQVATTANA